MRFDHLALRQLECLKVLVEERSVTRAAMRLGVSQPTLSGILAKLRQTFEDPLLVKESGGMLPTACALAIVEQYTNTVQGLGSIVANHSSFEIDTSVRSFRIQANDYLIEIVLVPLLSFLRKHAPNISIKIDYVTDKSFREHLESGQTDLIIGYLPISDDSLYRAALVRPKMCCISSKSHSKIKGHLDLDTFVSVPHLGMSLGYSDYPSFTDVTLDKALLELGLSRTKVMQVPTLVSMPAIVAQTDLIATVPLELAERAAHEHPIQYQEVPVPDFEMTYSMVWHNRTKKDPAHMWLRSKLQEIASSQLTS